MDSHVIASHYPGCAGLSLPDRRHEPRLQTALSASVFQLTGSLETLSTTVLEISGRGMKLRLASALPLETPISIEMEPDLILGEVRYCIRERDGSYSVGVEVDQILKNVREVARRWAEAAQTA